MSNAYAMMSKLRVRVNQIQLSLSNIAPEDLVTVIIIIPILNLKENIQVYFK